MREKKTVQPLYLQRPCGAKILWRRRNNRLAMLRGILSKPTPGPNVTRTPLCLFLKRRIVLNESRGTEGP